MKRSFDKEMMDMEGIEPSLLEEDLRHLQTLNRTLGAYRGLQRCLAKWAKNHHAPSISILDIGTGYGDIPVTLVQWARRNGILLRIVGIEPNPVTARLARVKAQAFPEISIVMGDAFHPPLSPSSVDFVFTSQVLHHFSDEEIIRLLKAWKPLARRGIMVSDLIRHPLAYLGILVFTRLLTRNPLTRNDGPLSVRRALTLEEWKDLFHRAAVAPFDITHLFPFRVFALFELGKS